MMTDFSLDELAVEAAKTAGYDGEVNADFIRTPDRLSVRWERSKWWVHIHVSHWLMVAQEDLVREVLIKVFLTILGKDAGESSDALKEWVEENRHRWEAVES